MSSKTIKRRKQYAGRKANRAEKRSQGRKIYRSFKGGRAIAR